MLLLVTDTSGKNGFVGLVRFEESQPDRIELVEEVPLLGGTFSAQLVPQIAGLLEKHNFQKVQIGAFIVVSGPGSFTGLRVGLAAIKALAEILQRPIVPVSLLEAVAVANRLQGTVLAALDAGRGEVYVGEYELVRESAQFVREQLLSRVDFLSAARESTVVTPDEGLGAIIRGAGISVSMVPASGAAMIARLGWRRLRAGETVSPEGLEANYIRRSDAEIFAKHGSEQHS